MERMLLFVITLGQVVFMRYIQKGRLTLKEKIKVLDLIQKCIIQVNEHYNNPDQIDIGSLTLNNTRTYLSYSDLWSSISQDP